MLTQEHTHTARIVDRLTALEEQLSAEGPPDLPGLRRQIRELRNLVRRAAGSRALRGTRVPRRAGRRAGTAGPSRPGPAALPRPGYASRVPAYISSMSPLYSRSTTGRFSFRLGVISPCSTSRSRGSRRNFLIVCHRWSPLLSSFT